jgi:hypothetical protein
MTPDQIASPLVPPECDLRHFQFMPLDVRRLLNSDLWLAAEENPRLALCAVSLWAEAWHSVPAGSLPDNDRVLQRLARCPETEWSAIRPSLLKSWTRCSDGRLYHKVVAEKACEAWLDVLMQRKSSQAGHAKRWGSDCPSSAIDTQVAATIEMLQRLNPNSRVLRRRFRPQSNGNAVGIPNGSGVGIAVGAAVGMPMDVAREGKGRDYKKKDASANAPALSDLKADLYRRAKEILGDSAGGMVTDLIKAKGTVPKARAVIEAASEKGVPRDYVQAIINKERAAAANGAGYDPGL